MLSEDKIIQLAENPNFFAVIMPSVCCSKTCLDSTYKDKLLGHPVDLVHYIICYRWKLKC